MIVVHFEQLGVSMACVDTRSIAAQLLHLMIEGEMPIDPKVTRHCCKKLASSVTHPIGEAEAFRLVQAIETLDSALLFKAPQGFVASLRSEALAEVDGLARHR